MHLAASTVRGQDAWRSRSSIHVRGVKSFLIEHGSQDSAGARTHLRRNSPVRRCVRQRSQNAHRASEAGCQELNNRIQLIRRTDLLTPSAPRRTMEAPDQAYGRVTAQKQSQRILPVGPQATAPAPVTNPGGSAPGPVQGGALPPAGIPGDPGPASTWLPSHPGRRSRPAWPLAPGLAPRRCKAGPRTGTPGRRLLPTSRIR